MVKVLLCGQVAGQWDAVWARARKLNAAAKSAPFEVLFCIGRVWPFPADYLTRKLDVPIATYCLPAWEEAVPSSAEDDASRAQLDAWQRVQNSNESVVEVVPNCFYLKKQGVATIAGLKVACASGANGKAELEADALEELQATLRQNADGVDFFLSAQYPAHFAHLVPDANVPPELKAVHTSAALEKLMKEITPRYHITSAADAENGGVFYQRLPYVTEQDNGQRQVTRLIGLCGVNTSKDKSKKYLHALQLVPCSAQTDPVEIPAGTTQNPYRQFAAEMEAKQAQPAPKRQRTDFAQIASSQGPATQFFFDPAIAARGQQRSDANRRRRTPPVPVRSECWFCLATPSVERHLIISIGREAYLAVPKGAINADHVLVIPIAHQPAVVQLSAECKQEIERFQDALRKYFASQDKDMIVIDRNINTIGAAHCHLQIIGVPRSMAEASRRVFQEEGTKYHVELTEMKPDETLEEATKGKSYFYAQVPDGHGHDIRLLNIVDGKHYVQFGRHAAACVLGVPGRANWKFCVVSKPEEEASTKRFKTLWKPFDFTAEDDEDDDDQ